MHTGRISAISSTRELNNSTSPFLSRPDSLRRTASDLMARFPTAESEDVTRALSRAAEYLPPYSDATSILLRASREMRKNIPATPVTDPIDSPRNDVTAA